MISAGQIRAARALVRMGQIELSGRANVSVETVKRLERGDGQLVAVKVSTIEAIRRAFDAVGVELTDPVDGVCGFGVRFKWGYGPDAAPNAAHTGHAFASSAGRASKGSSPEEEVQPGCDLPQSSFDWSAEDRSVLLEFWRRNRDAWNALNEISRRAMLGALGVEDIDVGEGVRCVRAQETQS